MEEDRKAELVLLDEVVVQLVTFALVEVFESFNVLFQAEVNGEPY